MVEVWWWRGGAVFVYRVVFMTGIDSEIEQSSSCSLFGGDYVLLSV